MDVCIDAGHSIYSEIEGFELRLSFHLDEREDEAADGRIYVEGNSVSFTYLCYGGDVIDYAVWVLWS